MNHWYFLIVFGISLAIGIAALRQNNLTMVRLRNEVAKADEQNGDVEGALRKLREHVHSHMNTDLSGPNSIRPPIQLKHRYERLVQAELERVAQTNSQIYTEAQTVCEQRFPAGLSGSGRIPCIQEYVTSRGAKTNPIPDALYKFDFVSPNWSPDLAGWSLVVSAASAALFVIRYGLERLIRLQLRKQI